MGVDPPKLVERHARFSLALQVKHLAAREPHRPDRAAQTANYLHHSLRRDRLGRVCRAMLERFREESIAGKNGNVLAQQRDLISLRHHLT